MGTADQLAGFRVKTGIFTIPSEAYHADPADVPSLSASIATLLCNRSPRHAWTAHPRLNPAYEKQEESRFDVGSACHAILLEDKPVEDVVAVVDADSWRTNAAKEARDEARAHHKIPLLANQLADVVAMLAATAAQLEAIGADPPLFRDGKAEQTLIWEEDGVVCRALVDWLRDDYAAMTDLKTTSRSAKPEAWSKGALYDHGCDIQAAMYLRGLRAITGQDAQWRWVVVETAPPYALSVIAPGSDVLAVANAKLDYALRLWRQCLEKDSWPAYAATVYEAELPAWADDAKWLVPEEVAA